MAKEKRNLRQQSKNQITSEAEEGCSLPLEYINTGSLQRIADATEKMAVNYAQIIEEKENYKRWFELAEERCKKKSKEIANMRGQITKLKNKLNPVITEK